MATMNDLCISITELSFDDAMARVLACRLARRQALVAAQEARQKKATEPKAKASAKAKAKPKTADELAAALSPEMKKLLLAELLGGQQ